MAESYQTLEGTLNIRAAGAVESVSVGDTISVVGGYDADNADTEVTVGETHTVTDPTHAEQLFGEESELARFARLARANGVGAMEMVPVAETQTTESVSTSVKGELSNIPMDPNVHPEHTIDVQDVSEGASVTTNIVYESPPPSPSDSNTVNINPVTKEWEADEESDYDFTYTHGDYGSAIDTAAAASVRFVAVNTESITHKNTLLTALETEASEFNFRHGIVGASPRLSGTKLTNYTPSNRHRRLIEVAPARCDGVHGGRVRHTAAVAGLLADQPIDVSGSAFYEDVVGVTDYVEPIRASNAADADGVTTVTRDFEVAQAVTTSDQTEFEKVYVSEIVDLVGEGLFSILKNEGGGGNTVEDRRDVAGTMRLVLSQYANATPAVLATGTGGTPYRVDHSIGASDTEAVFDVKIEPAPIMETVTLDIGVGEILTFGGATA